jgi:F-type H+-transporting ATPase subunit a
VNAETPAGATLDVPPAHGAAAATPKKGSRRNKILLWAVIFLAAIVAARILYPVPLPHIQLPAETLFVLPGNFAFTNTMLAIVTTDILLLLIAFRVRSKIALVPSGLTNVMEAVVEFWQNQATQIVGAELGRKWLPLVLTLFLLVGLANWSELIPGYDTIGIACTDCPHAEGSVETEHTYFVGNTVGGVFLANQRLEDAAEETIEGAVEEHTAEGTEEEAAAAPAEAAGEDHESDAHAAADHLGEHYAVVPFYRAASTDLNFTLGLALIAFTVIQYAGFKALGGGYMTKFFNFKEGGLGIFVGLVELISELSRIISFSFRLFGNIFAGQVLLFVIPFLLPFLVPVMVYGLELFVGLIQGYVFAILTLAFMGAAVTAHHSGDHH